MLNLTGCECLCFDAPLNGETAVKFAGVRAVSVWLGLQLLAGAVCAESTQDFSETPFEQLVQRDVVPASKLAQQVSDSPSAVAIVTAEDIRAYGYRTIADVLNSMRGLYTTHDYRYEYMGGRSFGEPGDYAGRIMLMIDGYATQDSLFNQAYVDHSGLIDLDLVVVTVCNQNFYLMGSMWDNDDIDKSPKIYEAVKQFLQTEKGKDFKIGQLKKRYSKTVHDSYLSHGCFYCDSIFGDWFLNTEKMDGQNDPNSIRHAVEIEFGTIKEEGRHWCYSDNGQYCE